MSVGQRVITEQGFGPLQDLVDLVKNPNLIEQAAERQRKAAKLTEEELTKASEARALIANADALRNELAQAKKELLADKAAHELMVATFNDKSKSISDSLNIRANELDAISKRHLESEKTNAQEKSRLATEALQTKLSQDSRESGLVAREKRLSESEVANNLESKRLSDWEAKLKAKAQRLAAEASKDD